MPPLPKPDEEPELVFHLGAAPDPPLLVKAVEDFECVLRLERRLDKPKQGVSLEAVGIVDDIKGHHRFFAETHRDLRVSLAEDGDEMGMGSQVLLDVLPVPVDVSLSQVQ